MLCKITNVLTGEECIRDATLMLRQEVGKTGTARALLPPGDDQAYFDEAYLEREASVRADAMERRAEDIRDRLACGEDN